jgi:uncharacterized protein
VRRFLAILLVLLCLPVVVHGQERGDEITLLTVLETDEGQERRGGTAQMRLEIQPGSGQVFIDSFPLTKIDTQISTRFAKQVACQITDSQCDNIDFYYTIRADSPVVGGPSAGGAATVLTAAVLEDVRLRDDVVMTGTINSDGFIGPVSGIEAKARAARANGFNTVVLPKHAPVENRNETVYADTFALDGIRVEPVTRVGEAYAAFTGTSATPLNDSARPSQEYQRIMSNVARDLCVRTEELIGQVDNDSQVLVTAQEDYQLAQQAIGEEAYYSAASYCFSANIELRAEVLGEVPEEEREIIRSGVKGEAERLLEEVGGRRLDTLSDVEASIIVKERLYEVLQAGNETSTAYLVERLESAKSWSSFFRYSGSQDVDLQGRALRSACLSRVNEAEERLSYLDVLGAQTAQYSETLEETRAVYRRGDYTYCLFKASMLKADMNSIINTLGVSESRLESYIDDKLELVGSHIRDQESFPILGYSYYRYSDSLKEEQPRLSAVFAEYASEFSSLTLYFEGGRDRSIVFDRSFLDAKSGVEAFWLGAGAVSVTVMAAMLVALLLDKRKTRD